MDTLIFQEHLRTRFKFLQGDWVSKKNNYEKPLCEALGVRHKEGRYWDAEWENCLLEFKKGTSIWLDLVRYSEGLLRIDENACLEVFTLFFVPDNRKERIREIIGVQTADLLNLIKLTANNASFLLKLSKHCPRSLNAQASVTPKDVRQIATFSIVDG